MFKITLYSLLIQLIYNCNHLLEKGTFSWELPCVKEPLESVCSPVPAGPNSHCLWNCCDPLFFSCSCSPLTFRLVLCPAGRGTGEGLLLAFRWCIWTRWPWTTAWTICASSRGAGSPRLRKSLANKGMAAPGRGKENLFRYCLLPLVIFCLGRAFLI